MGRVDAISVDGLTLWFWSGDHEAPHFHAKKAGEWEMRIYFLETTSQQLAFEIRWGAGPNSKLRAKLARLVADNQAALLEEWHTKTRTGA